MAVVELGEAEGLVGALKGDSSSMIGHSNDAWSYLPNLFGVVHAAKGLHLRCAPCEGLACKVPAFCVGRGLFCPGKRSCMYFLEIAYALVSSE